MPQVGFSHKGQVCLGPVGIAKGIGIHFLCFLEPGISLLENLIDG